MNGGGDSRLLGGGGGRGWMKCGEQMGEKKYILLK